MQHLDLFSRIGGFARAAEQVWPGIEHVFCDNDPFAQAAIRKHWPEATIYGDIKDLNGKELGTIDIVTGGFPCQPFSSSGSKRGMSDERWLWPEMLRVIKECRPDMVIGENVAGLISKGLDTVLDDLEAEGYTARPFVIPACAVDAPHRRDRLWICAYAPSERLHGRSQNCTIKQAGLHRQGTQSLWREDWIEVAARTQLEPMADGIPRELSRWRNRSLKAAGNAIVPAVAAEIMNAMRHALQAQEVKE